MSESGASAGKKMVEAVKSYVSRALGPVLARIDALESDSVMRYRGVWDASKTYRPGDVTTDHGSLHFCWAATTSRPGTSDDWQLCSKTAR